MEAEQDRSVKKHQAQQLGFNSLQVVLSVAMVAVGISASIILDCHCTWGTISTPKNKMINLPEYEYGEL